MELQCQNGTKIGTSRYSPYIYFIVVLRIMLIIAYIHRREPTSLIKPLSSDDPVKQNEYNEKVKKTRSKAYRHIILIRHGQYNLSGKNDEERVLTALGKH